MLIGATYYQPSKRYSDSRGVTVGSSIGSPSYIVFNRHTQQLLQEANSLTHARDLWYCYTKTSDLRPMNYTPEQIKEIKKS